MLHTHAIRTSSLFLLYSQPHLTNFAQRINTALFMTTEKRGIKKNG
jgi:hypothetical protein